MDHVYVIEGHDAVKIGVARVPAERLSQLQTGNPRPLRLAWDMPIAGDAYAVEAEAHAMLDRHRIGGEWFAVPPEVAVAAVSGVAYRMGAEAPQESRRQPERLSWPIRWTLATGLPIVFWTLALGPLPNGAFVMLMGACFALLLRARRVPSSWPVPLLTRAFFILVVPAFFLTAVWPGASIAGWMGYR